MTEPPLPGTIVFFFVRQPTFLFTMSFNRNNSPPPCKLFPNNAVDGPSPPFYGSEVCYMTPRVKFSEFRYASELQVSLVFPPWVRVTSCSRNCLFYCCTEILGRIHEFTKDHLCFITLSTLCSPFAMPLRNLSAFHFKPPFKFIYQVRYLPLTQLGSL